MQATAMSKFGPSSGDYLLTNTLCCKYGPEKISKIIEDEDADEPVLQLEVPTTLHGKLFHKSHPLVLKKLTLKARIDQDNNFQIWNQFNSIAQEVMIDKLVTIWFEMKNKNLDLLIYLADNVIPVIVLGLVKVLKDVNAKNILEAENKNNKYNPLNVLAQYILRFNPKYDNTLELNSYVHGMHWVVDKLKEECEDVNQHDILSKLIKEARIKRLANENVKLRRKILLEKRELSLTELFEAWKYNYKVTIIDIKNALYSYNHYINRLPETKRIKAELNCNIYDPNFMNEDTLFKSKFVENMMNLVRLMPINTYEFFFKFMMDAAKMHQQQIAKEERRRRLEKVFNYIAVEPSETISKQKVICLLMYFFNNQPKNVQEQLHHPKKWPMLDILEMKSASVQELNTMLTTQKDKETLPLLSEDNVCEQMYKRMEIDPLEEDSVVRWSYGDRAEQIDLTILKQEAFNHSVEVEVEEDEDDGNMFLNVDELSDDVEVVTTKAILKSSEVWTDLFQQQNHIIEPDIKDKIVSLSKTFPNIKNKNDRHLLNKNQFCEICDTFLNAMSIDNDYFYFFCNFMKNATVLTPKEREAIVNQAKTNLELKKLSTKINRIYDMWDQYQTGILNLKFVLSKLASYTEKPAYAIILEGLSNIKKKLKLEKESNINRETFHKVLNYILKPTPMLGYIEPYLNFLIQNNSTNVHDLFVSNHRIQLSRFIEYEIEVAAGSMQKLYNAIFTVILEDCKRDGEEKAVSCTISLLRHSFIQPKHGEFLITFVAGTFDIISTVPGTNRFFYDAQLSANIMQEGNARFITKLKQEKDIDFWSSNKYTVNYDGEGIRVPIKNHLNQVFGILNVDNILSVKNPCLGEIDQTQTAGTFSFRNDHLLFYEGIARLFSKGYFKIMIQNKLLKCVEAYIFWLIRRCIAVQELNAYFTEIKSNGSSTLYQFIHFEQNHELVVYDEHIKLEQDDNLFRLYLFTCCETGALTTGELYGETRIAMPFRNDTGDTIIVIEFNIGELKDFNELDLHEICLLTRLLNESYKEILVEHLKKPEKIPLAIEELGLIGRLTCRFDLKLFFEQKAMMASLLIDEDYEMLRKQRVYAQITHDVFKSVFLFLRSDLITEGILDIWKYYRLYLTDDLNDDLAHFDPTNFEKTLHIDIDEITTLIENNKRISALATNKLVVVLFFDWCCICLRLLKETRRFRNRSNYY